MHIGSHGDCNTLPMCNLAGPRNVFLLPACSQSSTSQFVVTTCKLLSIGLLEPLSRHGYGYMYFTYYAHTQIYVCICAEAGGWKVKTMSAAGQPQGEPIQTLRGTWNPEKQTLAGQPQRELSENLFTQIYVLLRFCFDLLCFALCCFALLCFALLLFCFAWYQNKTTDTYDLTFNSLIFMWSQSRVWQCFKFLDMCMSSV